MRWLSILVVVGCGGGGGGGGDDVVNPDGSIADGSAALDAPPSSSTRIGIVSVLQENPPAVGILTVALAGFFDGAPTETNRTDGACHITVRTLNPPAVGAGMVTITADVGSGSGAPLPTVLVPDAMHRYAGKVTQGAVYGANAMITISAAGDTVPVFSGGVTLPSAPTVTSPASSFGFQFDRAVGFAADWTGGSAKTRISISQHPDGSSRAVTIICDFAAGSGSTVIAPSSLSDLVAGNSSTNTTVIIEALAQTPVTSGGFSVSLEAGNFGFVAPSTLVQ